MDIKATVDEVLNLPIVLKTSLDSWNFESVFRLSLDVAVLVMKKTTSLSKDVNTALVVSVVSEVLEQLKIKVLSSTVQGKSTEVSEHWDKLKQFASDALPVVLSYLPQLNMKHPLLQCFSFCTRISSGVELSPAPKAQTEETQGSKKE